MHALVGGAVERAAGARHIAAVLGAGGGQGGLGRRQNLLLAGPTPASVPTCVAPHVSASSRCRSTHVCPAGGWRSAA